MWNEIFEYNIIHFEHYQLKVYTLLSIVLLYMVGFICSKLLRRAVYRLQTIEEGKKYALYRLMNYIFWTIILLIGLQIIGFNFSVILAGSAALLVGFGLGIQNLFSDYVSGIILLIDSAIKVNDVIEVNGLVCQVLEIKLRTTTVLTRDDKFIILPNTELTRNQIINWTHSSIASRFEVTVGVDYSSSISVVESVLLESAKQHKLVLKHPKPFTRFEQFDDSSLNFSLMFWSEEVFRVENIKSDLRKMILEGFRKEGVQIPFPQRVLHTVGK